MGGMTPLCCIDRRLTEPGEIQPGEIACIGEGRDQAGLKLGRCQVQEAMSQAAAESGMDAFSERTIQMPVPSGPATSRTWRSPCGERKRSNGIDSVASVPTRRRSAVRRPAFDFGV